MVLACAVEAGCSCKDTPRGVAGPRGVKRPARKPESGAAPRAIAAPLLSAEAASEDVEGAAAIGGGGGDDAAAAAAAAAMAVAVAVAVAAAVAAAAAAAVAVSRLWMLLKPSKRSGATCGADGDRSGRHAPATPALADAPPTRCKDNTPLLLLLLLRSVSAPRLLFSDSLYAPRRCKKLRGEGKSPSSSSGLPLMVLLPLPLPRSVA